MPTISVSSARTVLKQKRRYIILAPMIVCVSAVVMRHGTLPNIAPPELLTLSKKIAKIKSRQTYYAWQTNYSFLKFENYPRPSIERIDIRAGTETSLPGLQRQFGKSRMYPRFVISPDGKKALWEEADHGLGFRSTSLESSAPISDTLLSDKFWASASNPIWMPDRKRWIQLFASGKGISAVVFEDGTTKAVQEIDIGKPKDTSSGNDLMRTHLLGVTQNGQVQATLEGADGYRNEQNSRHIEFFAFSLDSTHPNVREYTITLPKGEDGYENNGALAHTEEVQLSPRGDQLAWLVHRQIEFPVQRWFSQWLPGKVVTSRLFTELRITDLNGRSGRTVGTIAFKKSNQPGSDERPFGMHWLQDGQHISFIFNGSLRVVPTD